MIFILFSSCRFNWWLALFKGSCCIWYSPFLNRWWSAYSKGNYLSRFYPFLIIVFFCIRLLLVSCFNLVDFFFFSSDVVQLSDWFLLEMVFGFCLFQQLLFLIMIFFTQLWFSLLAFFLKYWSVSWFLIFFGIILKDDLFFLPIFSIQLWFHLIFSLFLAIVLSLNSIFINFFFFCPPFFIAI